MASTRMSGADAAWLHMDRPRNLMIVNTVLWFDGVPDWPRVEDSFFDHVVEQFERFRSRPIDPPVTLGLIGPRWEPVELEAADHVRRVKLPRPGGDAELQRYVAQEAARNLDDRVPLWQLHLLDGYDTGGAILLRTHHALGDGPALMHVLNEWARSVPASSRPATRASGLFDRARVSVDAVRRDAGMLKKLVSGVPTKAAVLGEDLGGVKTVAWTCPTPLDHIKQPGAKAQATVNDVALAFIAGALRSAVPETASAPRVEAIIPATIRPKDEPIDESLGNRFGLIFASLPTNASDLQDRIVSVKSDMDRIKSTREARTVFDALTVLGTTPARGAQTWVDAFARRASAVITNINGPRRPLQIGSQEIAGMVLLVPSTGPVGLGVSICSYAGCVRFGVIADTAVMADAAQLADALEKEVVAASSALPD